MSFGAATLFWIIVLSAREALRSIKNYVRRKKIEYIVQHRFDIEPKAKCHCIDCNGYNQMTKKCHKLDRFMDEDWFCYFAEPTELAAFYKDK